MRKWGIVLLLAATMMGIIGASVYLPVARDDAEARTNIKRVMSLIKVGDDLGEAEKILRNAGFKLVYASPIKPTVKEDYLHQLVVVSNRGPNFFDTLSYVTSHPMPFTHKESSWVAINASLDGVITEIW